MRLKSLLKVIDVTEHVSVDFDNGLVVSDFPMELLNALSDEDLNCKVKKVFGFGDACEFRILVCYGKR